MGPPIRMTLATALVLRAVAAGHRYGFEIMDASGYPSGTVYPALRRLDGAGYLRSSWEEAEEAHDEGRPRRRIYEVTEQGRRALPAAEESIARARRQLDGMTGSPEKAR